MAKHLLDLGRITRETLDQLATRNDPVGERFGSTSSEPRPHTDKEMKCQEPSPHLADDIRGSRVDDLARQAGTRKILAPAWYAVVAARS